LNTDTQQQQSPSSITINQSSSSYSQGRLIHCAGCRYHGRGLPPPGSLRSTAIFLSRCTCWRL